GPYGPPPSRAHASHAATLTVTGKTQQLYSLRRETAAQASTASHQQMPLRTGRSPALFARAKAAATSNATAPHAAPLTAPSVPSATPRVGFNGMADSAAICPYFGGCAPPDMALATSPTEVLQGVNTSFTFYSTSGAVLAGPFNSQVFYGIPNPPNNCDPAGPFTSDPRAFYDPNTGLFWTALLQVEGNSFGIGANCPNTSLYWIANINVTTGVMHIYSFDMTLGGTVNAGADYTQFGFNKDVIALSGNMFDFSTGNFDFAETLFASKHAMENGLAVTANAFTQLTAGGILVDTVQPIDTMTPTNTDPGVEYLVNSFNIFGDPFGDDCLFTACHDFVVWAYDPATTSLYGTIVESSVGNPTYVTPPNADQPGCIQCVETLDTRITGTPVYSVGGGLPLISFSLDTSVSNGGPGFGSIVPGILWGQLSVEHGPGFVFASFYQDGYLAFAADRTASFGAMMQDKHGKLVMVFDTMGEAINPSIMIVSRAASDPLGTIGNASFIVKGPSPTFNFRWGDYEAASYDGFAKNHIWVASE
ncbi:MAG: hypothetical protein ACRDHP_10545, partial [Ktedonobacterales bacterium]